mmetsp:Transcript_59388/g.181134  ORF Transcript_59388/g.181134 Transcript_59388/m.181134 type:complete len:281 (-) Transcript_59388:536-1378(-)
MRHVGERGLEDEVASARGGNDPRIGVRVLLHGGLRMLDVKLEITEDGAPHAPVEPKQRPQRGPLRRKPEVQGVHAAGLGKAVPHLVSGRVGLAVAADVAERHLGTDGEQQAKDAPQADVAERIVAELDRSDARVRLEGVLEDEGRVGARAAAGQVEPLERHVRGEPLDHQLHRMEPRKRVIAPISHRALPTAIAGEGQAPQLGVSQALCYGAEAAAAEVVARKVCVLDLQRISSARVDEARYGHAVGLICTTQSAACEGQAAQLVAVPQRRRQPRSRTAL